MLVATFLLMLHSGIALAADNAVDDEMAYLSSFLRPGRDNQSAIKMIEERASGSPGARLVLGATYLDGRYVPQNLPLGFAYLQLVARETDPQIEPYRARAEEWMRASQSMLAGQELLLADQLTTQLEQNFRARSVARIEPAIRLLTAEPAIEFVPSVRFGKDPVQLTIPTGTSSSSMYRRGCAAVSRPGCPKESQATSQRRCTGEIVGVDLAPSLDPIHERKGLIPDYPVADRRAGRHGQTTMLVHLDSSGWVCGTVLVESSGTRSLDAAAENFASASKRIPATRNGTAVESLVVWSINFRLWK